MNEPNAMNLDNKPQNPPIFNLPRIIILAFLLMLFVHVMRDVFLSEQQQLDVLINAAFIPQRYIFPMAEQNIAYFTSSVTYSFLHGGYGHLLVNGLWLAAFGSVVARRIGVFKFCVFWVLSSIAAAAFFAGLNWGAAVPVIGASGVVSGLMGAATRFAFPMGRGFVRDKAHFLPRQSFLDAFSNRTVVVYLVFFFGINLLPALLSGATGSVDSVAWEAHIGGFLFGFLFFGAFDHKNWQ